MLIWSMVTIKQHWLKNFAFLTFAENHGDN